MLISISNRVMKIRKFGNVCSYQLCKGKKQGAYFIEDDGVILLIFPDNKNMIYVLNDILGFVGKLLHKLDIKLWCYAYYEELNLE